MGVDDADQDHTLAGHIPETAAIACEGDSTRAIAALHSDKPPSSAPGPVAYSQAEDGEEDPDDEPPTPAVTSASRYALAALLVLVTAGAFVVTTALLMAQFRPHAAGHISTPTAATPAASPAAEPLPPMHDPTWWNAPLEAIAQHQVPRNPDAIFVADLTAAGFTVTDPTAPILDAHHICTYLGQGHTPAEAAAQNIVIYPGMTATQSSAYVYAAIDAYCPQYQ